MKKKVLALVVLAAMLVSILPFAAFAATTYAADAALSRMLVSTATAEADGEDAVEIDIQLMDYNAEGKPEAVTSQADLYIYSTRGTADKIYVDGKDVIAAKENFDGNQGVTKVTVKPDGNGWFTLQVTSIVPGSNSRLYVSTSDMPSAVVDYVNGDMSAITAGIITDLDADTSYASYAFTAVEEYNIAFSGFDSTVPANGAKYQEITVTVTTKESNMPVNGEDVTFSINKTGAVLSVTDATTDAKGQAKVKITATRPGTYELTAKVGNKSENKKTTDVTFDAATINSVKMVGDDNQKIALDESEVTLKYAFYDANGNRIRLTTATLKDYDDDKHQFEGGSVLDGVTLMTMTKPSGAEISDNISVDQFDYKVNNSGNLEIEIQRDAIDKEGDYEIRLALVNGASVTYKFNVKEQGDITGMTISYDTTSLAAETGAKTDVPSVKLLDAEGYGKSVDSSDGIKFSIDNASAATISDEGVVTEDTEDPAVITVTAIDPDTKQVATTTINIVKKPSALVVTPKTSYSISEDASLDVQIVDVDGKPVSFGQAEIVSAEAEAIVLSAPAGGIASGDDVNVVEEVKEGGNFTVEVNSNKEGQVKVQVLLTVVYENGQYKTNAAGNFVDKDGNIIDDSKVEADGVPLTETKVLTGSAVVNFGAATVTGQNIIFMISSPSYLVGGVPVAGTSTPFVENGRTYLGIRDMAYSMGIVGDENVKWDNATQTATITKDGITVQVIVGANAIKVTKDGVTTEVAIDAPAQNKDGRVFLPFRAVFEAFGYSVEYANGVITCI